MISGENFGGIYLIYLLFALPHGAIHAILALIGISVLIVSNEKLRTGRIGPILNLAGALCLFLSLFFFFYNDKQGYNSATFEQTVPQLSLGLFGILIVGFVFFRVIWKFFKRPFNGNLSII